MSLCIYTHRNLHGVYVIGHKIRNKKNEWKKTNIRRLTWGLAQPLTLGQDFLEYTLKFGDPYEGLQYSGLPGNLVFRAFLVL